MREERWKKKKRKEVEIVGFTGSVADILPRQPPDPRPRLHYLDSRCRLFIDNTK